MYDICCIGHITSDKVVTPRSTVKMPGGTALYFSRALQYFDINYRLVTSLGKQDMNFVEDLKNAGIDVLAHVGSNTVCFENIYPENQDHRVQKVSQKAYPFLVGHLMDTQADMYHLGPLLADDMGVELIKYLSSKGKISLDVQGFLREVRETDVYPVGWHQKQEVLQYVHTLKANETEAEILTGSLDVYDSARILAEWGVDEVVITLGSMGSLIYADKFFYSIPAFIPDYIVDATGCGDTYMAGYLYQRSKGVSAEQSGRFAAAMATLKIEKSGPFMGTEKEVVSLLENSKTQSE